MSNEKEKLQTLIPTGENINLENTTKNEEKHVETIVTRTNDDIVRNNDDILQREVYWLDSKDTSFDPQVILSFHKDDILVRNIKPHDCRKLLINKYGNRSKKIETSSLHDIVIRKHDEIRERFKSEFRSSFENVCVRIAMEIGMRDGRCNYNYGHISRHVLQKPTFATICRLQYLLRGVFNNQIGWKIKLEKKLMKSLNLTYKDGFVSSLSENGCFLSIISQVMTQKHRDINRRLATKHSFIVVQRSMIHREKMKNSRMIADNQSYFSLEKNVEFKGENTSDKEIFLQELNETIPKTIRSQENEFNEVHYGLLENIVFPKGSLSRSNKIVAQ